MKRKPYTIVVVGAGIAGLMAAGILSEHFQKVILLEARDRTGGRIKTEKVDNIPDTLFEWGAEFIHGQLPLTLKICKENKIPIVKLGGEMVNLHGEENVVANEDHWNRILKLMSALPEDITLSKFLNRHFRGTRNVELIKGVKDYATGFDLADPDVASTMALYKEWSSESENQYRIKGGYGRLVDAISERLSNDRCEVHLAAVVQQISWRKNSVSLHCASGKIISAEKVLVTVPAGVWNNEKNEGFIHFSPEIPETIHAFRNIGFGSVIKIFLVFESPFWKERYKNASFFFTPHAIPTWWTQGSENTNLLTGWLGGTKAEKWEGESDDAVINAAITTLATSFGMDKRYLKKILKHSRIINWAKEPFTKGGYSFSTLATSAAKKKLAAPIENTIFFAGEALYEGRSGGTVEAALRSAIAAAEKIRKSS